MGDLEEKIARLREQYLYELSDDGYEIDDIFFNGDIKYNKNIDLMYTLGDSWCGEFRGKQKFTIQMEFKGNIKYKIITSKKLNCIYHMINKKYYEILNESEFTLPNAADDTCRLLINSLRRHLEFKRMQNEITNDENNCITEILKNTWSRKDFSGMICIRECDTFKRKYFNDANEAFNSEIRYFDRLLTLICCGNKPCAIDVFLWHNGEYKQAMFDLENNHLKTKDGSVILKIY